MTQVTLDQRRGGDDVVVEEEDDRAARQLDAAIPSRGGPGVGLLTKRSS